MPQMSPLPWLSLFLTFIVLLLTSNCINYFFFKPKILASQSKKLINKINWKW